MREVFRAASFTIVLGLLAVSATSCGSAAAERRHDERTQKIRNDYDAERSELAARWNPILAQARQLLEQAKAQRVEVIPRSSYQPVELVRESTQVRRIVEICRSMARNLDTIAQHGEVTPEQAKKLDHCKEQARSAYLRALESRYYAADHQWAIDESHGRRHLLEPLLAFSHNRNITLRAAEHYLQVQAQYEKRLARLKRDEKAALERSANRRDQEIDENRRRTAAAIAAGLKGFGDALVNSSTEQQPYSPGRSNLGKDQRGCSSDFDCNYGQRCVKNNYANSGRCMHAVNEYGAKTYDPPAVDSIYMKIPSVSDCTYDADCPVGFRCNSASGACLR